MDVNVWKRDCGNYIDLNLWTFYKYCTCGGTPKFKYKYNPPGPRRGDMSFEKQKPASVPPSGARGMELWVMPARDKFSLFNNGPAIINGAPIQEIKERLTKLCSKN